MYRYFLTILLLAASTLTLADQKYNPYENRWEFAESGAKLEYNPYEDEWKYP